MILDNRPASHNMCFNESWFCHFAEKESLKEISVLRIGIQWYKSRLHKAQSRAGGHCKNTSIEKLGNGHEL